MKERRGERTEFEVRESENPVERERTYSRGSTTVQKDEKQVSLRREEKKAGSAGDEEDEVGQRRAVQFASMPSVA